MPSLTTTPTSAAASTPHPRLRWSRSPASELAAQPTHFTAWDRLNALRGDLPLLDASAVVTALATLANGREELWIGRRGEQVLAMAVMTPQGSLRWATFQPSQMPLGCWVSDPALDAAAVAQGMLSARFCLAVTLTQIDPLLSPRPLAGAGTETADYIDTAWVDIGGSFETYWAARGKNLRQNMRKQRNKLAAENTHAAMRVWTAVADMAPALQRYGEMESTGWKAGQGTAIRADNAQGRFYRGLLEQAAARHEAVVYEYCFDDATVAMNLCLRRNGTLLVLKTTYDETIKAMSPAFLLREDELKQLFADGQTTRIEYYGRVMDWHLKLTDRQRTLYHLTAYRWPLVQRLAQMRRHDTRRAPESVPEVTTSEPA